MLYVDIEKRLGGFTLKAAFTVDGGTAGLFGPSGAGKSMTLKCIAGIEKPDRGVIQLNGRTLFDSSKRINLKPQKRGVGYLFQDYALFPNMTVAQNIMTGMRALPKVERISEAAALIKRFRLDALGDKRPSELSGGEMQRTALARIIASRPEVILLDEPFASLDVLLKAELIPYVRETVESLGEGILVSHDADEVLSICPRITPISGGVTGDTLDREEFYGKMKKIYERAGIDIGRFR